MGRTLHYELRVGQGKLAPATVMRVVATQVLWNRRFTWSCEQLALEAERIYPLWPHAGRSQLPKDVTTEEGWAIVNRLLYAGCSPAALARAGYVLRDRKEPGVGMAGFTKVRDDEWNAFLVVRFLGWVSRQVPEAVVHVTDEGDYILAGSVVCRGGVWSLDGEKIRAQREYLVGRGLDEYVEDLDQAVLAVRDGRFFADPLLAPYLDREQFKGLDVPKEELAGMAFPEVIAHLRFPGWDDGGEVAA